MGWGRRNIEQAIKGIRQIHRNGQVLDLWELARLIHHEDERTRSQKRITANFIHENLIDIFDRFESCRQLSGGLDPSHHNRITHRTHPNSVRATILQRFEWYYDLLAVLGKSNTMHLIS